MPFPPPPALAFIITGYPIFIDTSTASSTVFIKPICPGTILTPAFFANSLEVILSPMDLIASTGGPMNISPAFSKAIGNFGFSDKKPYPG